MQKCSQLKTVFFQTLGYSSVTQNYTNIKKSQLVTFTSAILNERKQSHCKYFIELQLKCLIK